MKYKVGDKVRVKEDLVDGERYSRNMVTHLGKQATITYVSNTYVSSVGDSLFRLDIDNGAWWWTVEMLEPIEEEPSTTPNNIVTIDLDKLSDKDRELVKSIVDKVENPFDIPTDEHTYYYITSRGEIIRDEQWTGDSFDIECYMLGNYFQTWREAKFELEKRKILRKLEILSQKAGALDWGNLDEPKYSIRYNHYDDELRIFEAYGVRCIDRIHFPTKESLQDAIKLIGESRIKKYIFGVED